MQPAATQSMPPVVSTSSSVSKAHIFALPQDLISSQGDCRLAPYVSSGRIAFQAMALSRRITLRDGRMRHPYAAETARTVRLGQALLDGAMARCLCVPYAMSEIASGTGISRVPAFRTFQPGGFALHRAHTEASQRMRPSVGCIS